MSTTNIPPAPDVESRELTLTRIITAIIACFTGVGAIAYLIAWIIIPEEPYALPTNPI